MYGVRGQLLGLSCFVEDTAVWLMVHGRVLVPHPGRDEQFKILLLLFLP